MNTAGGKKVVLVVEDEESLRNALYDKLVREGFSVFVAPDGEQGLALALREHPDLILLDILMPKMNGIEMVKQLRTDAWGKEAKVVILTNVADASHLSTALDEKIFNYLIKSDTPLEDLMVKVREMSGLAAA
jgi:two-component system, OmpR family, response regulator MprA